MFLYLFDKVNNKLYGVTLILQALTLTPALQTYQWWGLVPMVWVGTPIRLWVPLCTWKGCVPT